MSHLDEKIYRKLLEARAVELHELNEVTQANASPVKLDQAAIGRLSRMDAMQQQAMSEETRRRRRRELILIDAALMRIEEGEYGYCLRCGEEIPEARLKFDPAVAHCIKHATS